MLKLLKLLSYVYVHNLNDKTKDYRKGFADCLELLRFHLLQTGVINQIVLLEREVALVKIAKDAEYNLILKKTKEYKETIERLNTKVNQQRQNLDYYQHKIEQQKERGIQFRRNMLRIIDGVSPDDNKVKRIANILKSYNDVSGTKENCL